MGLNAAAWHKVQVFHPGVSIDVIEETVSNPDRILLNEEHGSLNYVSYMPERRFFRLVGVKEWPDRHPRFQIATAYNPSLPPRGKKIWHRPTRP